MLRNSIIQTSEAVNQAGNRRVFNVGDLLSHDSQTYTVVSRTSHKNSTGSVLATGILLRYENETFVNSRTPPCSAEASGSHSKEGVNVCNGSPTVVNDTHTAPHSRKKKKQQKWLAVSLDAEWQEVEERTTKTGETWKRKILSQQWGFQGTDGHIYVWVLSMPGRASLTTVIGWLLEVMKDQGIVEAGNWKSTLDLEIRTFYGVVDLTTFFNRKELLKELDGVRRTLTTIEKPVKVSVWDKNRNKRREVRVSVRDLTLLAPAGSNLAALGQAIGVPKVELPAGYEKNEMERLLKEQPEAFLVYAAHDATITMLWPLMAYGGGPLDVSIGSKAAREMRDIIKQNRGWNTGSAKQDNEAFLRHWQGYEMQEHGSWTDKNGRLHKRYIKVSRPAAVIPHKLATEAFYGGRNECYKFGIDKGSWTDFDLSGAYASAMAMLHDPDWEAEPLFLTGQVKIENPLQYIFGRVKFSFPTDTKYPCLPIRDTDGAGLVFPLEGETFASAPELWLAQKMGARLEWVGAGVHVPAREEKSLFEVMKQWIAEREEAKKNYGKGSVQEVMKKERNNTGYGKLAQGLSGSRGWSPRHEKVKPVPESSVTSPLHAAMITGIIRACVSAAMHQLSEKGVEIGSVTTDGFLAQTTLETLDKCDGLGLLEMMRDAREATAGSREIWEIKHRAEEIAFMRTRGQIGRATDGAKPPIARAGLKAPPDKKHDSHWLLDKFIERDGYLEFIDNTLPSLREYSLKGADGTAKAIKRRVSWDFDHKRRWLEETVTTTTVTSSNGLTVHHVCVDTAPWQTFDEFKAARAALASRARLESVKTKRDFEHTQTVIKMDAEARRKHRIASIERGGVWRAWAISVLRGLRSGELRADWTANATSKEVLDKVGHVFGVTLTAMDWKNAGRSSRQTTLLDGADAYLKALDITYKI